jgi:hypothetical protein
MATRYKNYRANQKSMGERSGEIYAAVQHWRCPCVWTSLPSDEVTKIFGVLLMLSNSGSDSYGQVVKRSIGRTAKDPGYANALDDAQGETTAAMMFGITKNMASSLERVVMGLFRLNGNWD